MQQLTHCSLIAGASRSGQGSSAMATESADVPVIPPTLVTGVLSAPEGRAGGGEESL